MPGRIPALHRRPVKGVTAERPDDARLKACRVFPCGVHVEIIAMGDGDAATP